MKIKYDLSGEEFWFDALGDLGKVSGLLSNNKGDFLQIAGGKSPTKFFGFNICEPVSCQVFKVIDDFVLEGEEVASVKYNGYEFEREYKPRKSGFLRVPVDEVSKVDHTFGEKGVLGYNSKGQVEEVVDMDFPVFPKERFFLGPAGGLVYEVSGFEGEVFVDLDVRKFFDFDVWGRDFEVYEKNGVIFVKYVKRKGEAEDYEVFLGVRGVNLDFRFVREWVKKEYSYCLERGSLAEWYVYRFMSLKVKGAKRLVFGAGFSEAEVVSQIVLLERHFEALVGFEREVSRELFKLPHFELPIPQDVSVAYRLASRGGYVFLKKDFMHGGSFAGFPWFTQVWSRDDLISLRLFINRREFGIVKSRIFACLNCVDENGLKRLLSLPDSESSVDAVFLLAKRFEDFVAELERAGRFDEFLSKDELKFVYSQLSRVFYAMVSKQWDKKEELLRVKFADSWMDTIPNNLPLDIQVGLLEFVSVLSFLAEVVSAEEVSNFVELESLLREKIRKSYFRNGVLYDEPYEDKLSCNVFFAYYLYPELFFKSEWEEIFDRALVELRSSWGGIASLSRRDSRFREEYTGENNLSYHCGDVWFWIDNVAGICLHDLNERKYRGVIAGILNSSTRDILKFGTIGFASEVSSFKEQGAQGCFAQAWSGSTYVELVDRLFGKIAKN